MTPEEIREVVRDLLEKEYDLEPIDPNVVRHGGGHRGLAVRCGECHVLQGEPHSPSCTRSRYGYHYEDES